MSELAIVNDNIEVCAETPDEMRAANQALIGWCEQKIARQKVERIELEAAYEIAVQKKWKATVLKRHLGYATRRVTFYEKMKAALVAGYSIVPSFPITAFAIRTDKTKPLQLYTNSWSDSHTQKTEENEPGKGEYKNPFPVVHDYRISPPTATEAERRAYVAKAWKELEFPLSMSKPHIMQAADRAMAIKVFDDLGILPGFDKTEGTRAPQADPMIIGRIIVPRKYENSYTPVRYLSFIIAWALDTKTL